MWRRIMALLALPVSLNVCAADSPARASAAALREDIQEIVSRTGMTTSDVALEASAPEEGSIILIPLTSYGFAWTEEFYESVFDWSFQPLDNDSVLFHSPGGQSGRFRRNSASDTGHAAFYIYCHNVRTKLQEIAAAGGTVDVEELPLPGYGWSGMFTDPDGNTIGLLSTENPPPDIPQGSTCSCRH